MRCRMGDNLAVLTWDDIRVILQASCLGESSQFNATMLAKFKANNITLGAKNNNPGAKNGTSRNLTGINPYYHDLKVPGS